MALSIDATVGSASANSFVTEAEMDTFCEGRLNASAWTSNAAALPALVEATRLLSLQSWKGERTDDVQALSWPRAYCPDPDVPSDTAVGESGVPEYDDDIIPQRVKDATCELALQFLKAGTSDLASPSPSEGVTRRKVDVLETEYADPGLRVTRGLGRFPLVLDLIAPLLETARGGLRVTRV